MGKVSNISYLFHLEPPDRPFQHHPQPLALSLKHCLLHLQLPQLRPPGILLQSANLMLPSLDLLLHLIVPLLQIADQTPFQ